MDHTTRGGLILATVVLMVGLASCVTGGMLGSWAGHGVWGWPLGVGGLGILLFWGTVVLGVYVVSRKRRSWRVGETSLSPMDIVKRRYAQGEITRDQYEQMKKDLAD